MNASQYSCAFLFLVILLIQNVCAQEAKTYSLGSRRGKLVMCYLTWWSANRASPARITPEDLDPSLCTHIIFAFAGLNEVDFSIKSLNGDFDTNPETGWYKRVLKLKERNPELKVFISVGGWDEGTIKYSNMVSKPESRKAFIDASVKFLRQYQFDGLDFHWKFPGQRGASTSDRFNLVLLAKEMKQVFTPLGYTLAMIIGCDRYVLETSYVFPDLSQNVDYIIVLGYDYHGIWDATVGVNAPLRGLNSDDEFSLEFTLKYLFEHNVNASQLILGIPIHGRNFLMTTGTDEVVFGETQSQGNGFKGIYTKENGFLAYNEICFEQSRRNSPWTRYWHEESSTPYMRDRERLITYDDHQSLTLKVNFALEKQLAGVAVWALDMDDRTGKCQREDLDGFGSNLKNYLKGEYTLMRSINLAITATNADPLSPADQLPKPECNPTMTKVRGSTACAGQVIFHEQFNSLSEDVWKIEQYIPVNHPEYPFVSYQRVDNDPIIKVKKGHLSIKPRLQRDMPGFNNESIFTGQLNLFSGCTEAQSCVKRADGADILPPIVSGRMTTKNFAFTYGVVFVRARLPIGDWVYPEILLEPFLKKYGAEKFMSGVIKIASARGNQVLHQGSLDYSNKVLYSGAIMDFKCRDTLISTRSTTDGRPWGDRYHLYSMRWEPDLMTFSVDGEEWFRVEKTSGGLAGRFPRVCKQIPRAVLALGAPLAPFDSYFYLTLGVAAGGVTDFADGTTTQSGPKPWSNTASKAMYQFWQDTDVWYSTWSNPEMTVDYIKVVAL